MIYTVTFNPAIDCRPAGQSAAGRGHQPRHRRGLRAGRQGHQRVRRAGAAGLRERGTGPVSYTHLACTTILAGAGVIVAGDHGRAIVRCCLSDQNGTYEIDVYKRQVLNSRERALRSQLR